MDDQIKQLEKRVDDLIRLCGQLRSENQDLRSGRDDLNRERQRLVERNREAKLRLERIIERLKTLEQES